MTTNRTPRWVAISGRWHLISLAGLYIAVLAVLVVYNSLTQAPVRGRGCPATPTTTVSGPPSGKKPATLALREGQSTTIPFNRSLGLRKRRLEFDVTDPDKVMPASDHLVVSAGTFLRATGDSELNPDLITVSAQPQNRSVFLGICIDRTGEPKLGDPGVYTGVVSIADPRVSRVDIPLTVSLAYNAWPLVLALFVLSLGPATVYLWLLRSSFKRGRASQNATRNTGASGGQAPEGTVTESSDGKESPFSGRVFGQWVFSRTGIMAVGAGVGAAFVAFSAGYLKNPAWGASVTDLIGLSGAMFTAFVAAATSITAARTDEPEP